MINFIIYKKVEIYYSTYALKILDLITTSDLLEIRSMRVGYFTIS